jgi:tungstate transport system substrate-binding protein
MAQRDREAKLDRRQFVKVAAAGGAAIAAAATAAGTAACGRGDEAPRQAPARAADRSVVRVASVPTAVEGNVLPALIADFERHAPYRVELTTTPHLYDLARLGKLDLVVSHYGHRDAEQFVLDGLGEWPRTLFSNQMALIGPPHDPAGVRDLADAGEAFRRIAASAARGGAFVLNDLDGVRYLTEILWHAAERPARAGWFLDLGVSAEAAIERASQLGAYTLWGLTPFVRLRRTRQLRLEPLVLADPLLQRMLVSIVVKPRAGAAAGIAPNAVGAAALQAHLLTPAVQAQIRTIRYPGMDAVTWVPAGRHNRTEILPKV